MDMRDIKKKLSTSVRTLIIFGKVRVDPKLSDEKLKKGFCESSLKLFL